MAGVRFQVVMTKPTGALCNLSCRYCYYLDKRSLYPQRESFRMTDDLLEAYIRQHIEASPGELVTFAWHGGEPTILGLDYFRRIVALQKRHRPAGRRLLNNLQTNGTLLDDEWCRFLAAEGFFVGLSLDGPAAYHDRYRVARGGEPTHADVLRGWRLLQRHRVRCDVLCVVHAANVGAPTAVYRFFKELGAQSLQFLPLVERTPGGVSERTPSAAAVGDFLCAIFDEWIRHDVGRVVVQIFDEGVRAACGLEHALCVFRETCGDVPVIEHNGDFFACDHFVDPAHRIGNIGETALAALLASPAQLAFGAAKRNALSPRCRGCAVLSMCNGGCPKDRVDGLSYLCAGYERFFSHARPALERLAALWRAGRPPERIMDELRAAESFAGRNDPCPCGSGRKFKRCCLGRVAPRPSIG